MGTIVLLIDGGLGPFFVGGVINIITLETGDEVI